jgi:two-component system, OmpR family, alkaline phosphatase synthesis response regulator PhoP
MKKVIIIEDELNIGELVQLHLEDMECETRLFTDGLEGFKYAVKHPFDLLVLDINLPGMNGIDICSGLREAGIGTPILMLTARTEEADKIIGLESGADDYITKPFSIREFLARVKAIFRRAEMGKEEVQQKKLLITYKGLEINLAKRKVREKGRTIDLSPKEFDLLYLLASHPGVTFDRKDLLHRVWTQEYAGYEHTVNSHINRLRNKIEKDPDHPRYVLTTWGVGYRFNDE